MQTLSPPPTLAPALSLPALLESELSQVPVELLQAFCNRIYPTQTIGGRWGIFAKAIVGYSAIEFARGTSYEMILDQIARLAGNISDHFAWKLVSLLGKEQVRGLLIEAASHNNINNNTLVTRAKPITAPTSSQSPQPRKQIITTPPPAAPSLSSIPCSDPCWQADRYMKQKHKIPNLVPQMLEPSSLSCSDRICLMCQKSIGTGGVSSSIFECLDCRRVFHAHCMPRDGNCCFCQLWNIHPMHRVKDCFFMGVLPKGVKSHLIQFDYHAEDHLIQTVPSRKPLVVPATLELRSLRLQPSANPVTNFINLFPDACTVSVNNRLLKQFQPLHKQSSLKYRRDECVKVPSNLVNIGKNRILINERCEKKDVRADERIELQDHLFAVFTIKDLGVPTAITTKHVSINRTEKLLQDMEVNMSDFQHSVELLKKSMLISSVDGDMQEEEEQIRCETIKAPLTCSLTLQKMRHPGRSIFCKHFACFDISNFIMLNVQAKLPKWQCPICKISAYKFQIDCIMGAIIGELQKLQPPRNSKEEEEPVEVEFDRGLNIRLRGRSGTWVREAREGKGRANGENIGWLGNVMDLPIEGKTKRERATKGELEGRIFEDPCAKLTDKGNQELPVDRIGSRKTKQYPLQEQVLTNPTFPTQLNGCTIQTEEIKRQLENRASNKQIMEVSTKLNNKQVKNYQNSGQFLFDKNQDNSQDEYKQAIRQYQSLKCQSLQKPQTVQDQAVQESAVPIQAPAAVPQYEYECTHSHNEVSPSQKMVDEVPDLPELSLLVEPVEDLQHDAQGCCVWMEGEPAVPVKAFSNRGYFNVQKEKQIQTQRIQQNTTQQQKKQKEAQMERSSPAEKQKQSKVPEIIKIRIGRTIKQKAKVVGKEKNKRKCEFLVPQNAQLIELSD